MERRKRKRRRTNGPQTESHGSQTESHGYQAESHGYQAHSKVQEEPDEWDDSVLALAEKRMEPSEGWWNNYGFASFGEYLKASHEEGEKVAALFRAESEVRRRRPSCPAAQLPKRA